MSLKNNKLVALLGGRPYADSITLRRFLIPPVRSKLKELKTDFIIATNNPASADQFEQIKGLTVVRTSPEIHEDFICRQREIKSNLGAETRETINQYAINNKYEFVCHLDDNITSLFYRDFNKNRLVKKNKPATFLDLVELLFFIAENSNAGTVGLDMSSVNVPKPNQRPKITAGFPYSFFVHRVDPNFKFENATEDDILMSIYNGINHKPSAVIRNSFYYGKTGKRTAKDGNRKLYNEMLKENKRGEYCYHLHPDIYTRKVSYMAKSSTKQKEPMLQHKHILRKPAIWDKELVYKPEVIIKIKEVLEKITQREIGNDRI